MRRSVLVVDDEELIRRSLRMALDGAGYAVQVAANGAEALAAIAADPPDCALIDLRLGDVDGLTVLAEARRRIPGLKAIVITAHGDVDSAIQALRSGAYDFIRKPFDLEEIIASVKNALRTDELERQVAYLSGRSSELIFAAPAMGAVMELVRRIASQPVPVVLILGETGTGKELVARALHRESARAGGPFIDLNCSAIPESLVESELFGHERGAFSDAREQKRGLVELADEGTLFLDEIGDLPAPAQAKLLRFVERREFRRVGGTALHTVDCRMVAATHQRLDSGPQFRRDLYFRLAGVTITLPPLRERGDDVLLLAQHFLGSYARQYRKDLGTFTPEAARLLRGHHWPGNVRELKAVIAEAALMADADPIGVEHLRALQRSRLSSLAVQPQTMDDILAIEDLEQRYVRGVLELCGGNKMLAAEKLGISRQTLARWLADGSET
ncbi:sigma-54-dependent Fis family transcriptional regulator [bacterium]|nr:sigma-54-dependent Fis family transcriptional regulator [bacterium]